MQDGHDKDENTSLGFHREIMSRVTSLLSSCSEILFGIVYLLELGSNSGDWLSLLLLKHGIRVVQSYPKLIVAKEKATPKSRF